MSHKAFRGMVDGVAAFQERYRRVGETKHDDFERGRDVLWIGSRAAGAPLRGL